MKHMKRTLSLLLTLCMLLGCMAVGVMAADPVVDTARGSAADPIPVYSNYADNSYGSVTLDVDATISDDGVLTFYDYGTVTSNAFQYLTVESNNEKVATVAASSEGGTLRLAFTGVANGVATVTVDYTCTTSGGNDSIYGTHSGAATGKLYYTVKVGTGSSTPVTPDQPGGDGELKKDTEGRYVIYNQADLEAVAKKMDASYIVANDIALTGNWKPLGWTDSEDVPFTGTLDGNGYTISGLGMDYENGTYVGLFAINNGTIKDLSVVIDDIGGDQYVGAIAGRNDGTISNVTVTQKRAFSTGDSVTGYSKPGQYDSNYSYAGGIAGLNKAGAVIEHCFVNVCVNGYYFIGGITGANNGTIRECAFTGGVNHVVNNTKGIGYVGGIAGGTHGTVTDCYVYNAGLIKGQDYVGGAFGRIYSDAQISNIWVDPVQAGVSAPTTANYAGRFAGQKQGSVSASYAVVTQSPSGTQGGANRVLVSYLQDQETFPSASGWNFEGIWFYDNTNYPVLRNCGNSGEHEDIKIPGESVTVTFLGGGLEGDTVTDLAEGYSVASGTEINLPAAPVRTNALNWVYDFKGWSDGENTYDVGAAYTVTGNVTFTATWKLHSVNGDGEWTYLDAMTIMDYLAGNITLTAEQIEAADYNHDDVVSYLDAMRIMDVLAGNG